MEPSRYLESTSARRWHDAAYWGIMAVALAVFYWMNVLTTFKEDDMAFALVGRLGSVGEVLRAHCQHFMTSNGRFSDVMATLFCAFLGKPLFNVVNTLVLGLMLHLLSLLVTGRRSVLVLAVFLAVVGCCYPVPGQTLLFVAGSCNYLWAITASLLLVYYLLRHPAGRLGWGKGVLLLLGAFVAGNFNEATSFGFFAGLVLYYVANRDRFDRRVALALAGYLLGIVLIVASPGAWSRAAGGGINLDLGVSELLSSRWHIFIHKMWHMVTPLTAAVAVVVVLLWKGWRTVKRHVWVPVFVCLLLVMFALGVVQERAYAPLATVGFIITMAAIDALLARRGWLRLAFIVGCLALVGYTYAHAVKAIRSYYLFEEKIKRELASSSREAVLLERRYDGSAKWVTPLSYVSSEYFVREDIYCAFYEKDNVQFVPDSVLVRYREGRLLDGAVEMPLTSNRPDFVSAVLRIPRQDYMVVTLKVDTMPFTTQQASLILHSTGTTLTQDDVAFRRKYGLATDHVQRGFYPLRYQGKVLLVFPAIDDNTSSVVFPIDFNGDTQVTLTRVRLNDKTDR